MPSWMLQPHNYPQATGSNLYNVAYRRTATYKGVGMHGLGQMGPLYTCPTGEQVFTSSDCPGGGPISTMSTSDQLQSEIDALFGYTGAGAAAPGAMNWTPWLIGGGVLLVLLMSRGRR
jgi:hypothetical protein